MNITPWRARTLEPRNVTGSPMLSLQNEIDRLFDQFVQMPMVGMENWMAPTGRFTPRIDVQETDSGVVMTAELPGMVDKDVEVQVTDDMLVLRGEKKAETERSGAGWQCTERSYGRFERSFMLGSDYELDKATASFKRGILTVTVPRKKGAKPMGRKVAITPEH